MSDLLNLNIAFAIFQGATVIPPSGTTAFPQRTFEYQGQTFKAIFRQTSIAPNTTLTLTLPDAPYDAMFYMETTTPVNVNINSQGNQLINEVLVTQAITNTVVIDNNITPPGGTGPVTADIWYYAAQLATG